MPWGISPNSLAENTDILREPDQSFDFKTKKNDGGYTYKPRSDLKGIDMDPPVLPGKLSVIGETGIGC